MNTRSQRGYTLLELLVYVACLAMFLNVSFEAYFRYNQKTQALRRNAIELVQVLRAGERWRADVREAVAPPRLSEGASGSSFIISQKDGEVLYTFSNGTVRRQAKQKSVPVLSTVRSSTIERDVRQRVVSWRWELELMTERKGGAVRPLFTFESIAPVQR
jgi:Tfp pilus assembly protein PilE